MNLNCGAIKNLYDTNNEFKCETQESWGRYTSFVHGIK